MKALIRNTGETVRETDGIDGIDWTTGAPLTNERWCGGAYALAADCPPDAEPSDFDITEETVTVQEACTPPLTAVTVITAAPSRRAVTRPLGSTEATSGSELLQATPRSSALWGI